MSRVRAFLETAIASALDYSLLGEHELLEEVTVELLVESLGPAARARLLAACLKASSVDAELFVRTVGVAELCESLPLNAVWRAVAIAGARASSTSPELPVKKSKKSKKKVASSTSDAVPAPTSTGRSSRSVSSPSVPQVSASDESVSFPEGTATAAPEAAPEPTPTPKSRKPNRRASGAGATSRRLARESSAPSDAMFVSSRRRSSSRAATEVSDPQDEPAEIEVVDETQVGIKT